MTLCLAPSLPIQFWQLLGFSSVLFHLDHFPPHVLSSLDITRGFFLCRCHYMAETPSMTIVIFWTKNHWEGPQKVPLSIIRGKGRQTTRFHLLFSLFLKKYLFSFIYLFGCMRTLSCSMWSLVPWPGVKPASPALRAQILSHWITREVPILSLFSINLKI